MRQPSGVTGPACDVAACAEAGGCADAVGLGDARRWWRRRLLRAVAPAAAAGCSTARLGLRCRRWLWCSPAASWWLRLRRLGHLRWLGWLRRLAGAWLCRRAPVSAFSSRRSRRAMMISSRPNPAAPPPAYSAICEPRNSFAPATLSSMERSTGAYCAAATAPRRPATSNKPRKIRNPRTLYSIAPELA